MQPPPQRDLLKGFTAVPNLISPHPKPLQNLYPSPSIIFHHQIPKLWDAHHNNTICITKAHIAKASF